eukprot:CAMPEP_0114657230 /NCGR_PEP_ID=MMETSP0191-20121206/13549_1 /TAXON_ID=126664 /ORGANISM="Sorites sp." /LENGTH=119 /DNA_ID=CAMNT_0001876063 /DNA_START=40 /DNA_END=399 /DNA_ORIENTATION=+
MTTANDDDDPYGDIDYGSDDDDGNDDMNDLNDMNFNDNNSELGSLGIDMNDDIDLNDLDNDDDLPIKSFGAMKINLKTNVTSNVDNPYKIPIYTKLIIDNTKISDQYSDDEDGIIGLVY